MTFEQLYYFCEVYHQKSISLSSYNLNVSRQSLSASIKRLEDELNVTLFERSISGVEPTSAGKHFYDYAQNTLIDHWKLKQDIVKSTTTLEPTLYKIGVCDYIMATYGKFLYNDLSQKFPEHYFSFSTLGIDELSTPKEHNLMLTLINAQNLKLTSLKKELGEKWEVKYLCGYTIHVWLSKKSSLAKSNFISFDALRKVKFCTLKSYINEAKTQLDSFLGYYKMTTLPLSVQLEENFIEYIVRFNFTTIDIPLKNNELAYTEIFKDKDVIALPTDVTVALITIYQKNVHEYLYQYLYNLLLSNQ